MSHQHQRTWAEGGAALSLGEAASPGRTPVARSPRWRAFAAACDAAGIPARERESLWSLRDWWRHDDDFAGLVEEHGHWMLYRRSREGDAPAAAAFERHWRRYVRAFCSGRFTSDEADDLTATFFERAYDRVPSTFRWQCPFTVYLRQVLVNLSRDLVRSRQRRKRRELSLQDGACSIDSLDPEDATPGPEGSLIASQRGQLVRSHLEELPDADRRLLVHCFLEGGSAKELATELGIKPNAIYQRLHRAKRRLRGRLERAGLIESLGESS